MRQRTGGATGQTGAEVHVCTDLRQPHALGACAGARVRPRARRAPTATARPTTTP